MAEAEILGVPQGKVVDYLLNLDHPRGKSKANFFLPRGFAPSRPEEMANALARQAVRLWPGDVEVKPGCRRHRVYGPIDCPDGSTPSILTVWQIEDGETTAFLITARPGAFKPG